MNFRPYIVITGVGIFLLGILVVGLFNAWPKSGTQTTQKSTQTPITVNLEISKAPKLEEVVTVKLKINLSAFKTVFKAENTEAGIVLPDGAVKVDGGLDWKGDLIPEKPVELVAKIKFIKEGNWGIKGHAKYIIDAKNSWGDADYIYLNVSKHSGSFGFKGLKSTEETVPLE